MPYRKRDFKIDGFYHVYNRGVNKGNIFFSGENYVYCLNLMRKYAKKYSVPIIAYCLMPNHHHFLFRQDSCSTISKFINVTFIAYVQGVNKERGRSGLLFEGRFKKKLIDKQEYLLHLSRYIHLNPVSAEIVDDTENWPYSNYLEWIGKRKGELVDVAFVKAYFPNQEVYADFVKDYQISKEMQQELEGYCFE